MYKYTRFSIHIAKVNFIALDLIGLAWMWRLSRASWGWLFCVADEQEVLQCPRKLKTMLVFHINLMKKEIFREFKVI